MKKIKGDQPKNSVADLPAEGRARGYKPKEVKSTCKWTGFIHYQEKNNELIYCF